MCIHSCIHPPYTRTPSLSLYLYLSIPTLPYPPHPTNFLPYLPRLPQYPMASTTTHATHVHTPFPKNA